jgi:hypothetical protein
VEETAVAAVMEDAAQRGTARDFEDPKRSAPGTAGIYGLWR